ncbi:hypothetical protein PAXRUDRAFT_836552 [Paxillus rubicundulus Ve08.2h10]|uniref:Uncharacterized protein n=1 Tax=Paxillus rubicundulus Ve08.2h10 TaxID=930991 RepID=A0A0D0CMY2_9AGAM|nr:hypothetical protein PAXRUDRAFT_836552 [Paxillus rubicundulus Ve08.2h10]
MTFRLFSKEVAFAKSIRRKRQKTLATQTPETNAGTTHPLCWSIYPSSTARFHPWKKKSLEVVEAHMSAAFLPHL